MVEARLAAMESWEKGVDYALAVIASALLRSNLEPNVNIYIKTLIMDDSRSTSCCLCHRYVRKSVRKIGIVNAKLAQGLLGVVSMLLQFFGISAIRDTR